jgi:biopolymer transport protein ExbD
MIRTGLARRGKPGKKGGRAHGSLTLIPMIDMLMILVVYLLVHSADTEILPNTQNITIPQSVSEDKPRETTVVTVTRDMLYVDGVAVLSVDELSARSVAVVDELRKVLAQQAENVIPGQDGPREVTVMAERSLPYAVLRKIVASCSAADYSKVSLAVVEREQVYAGLSGA